VTSPRLRLLAIALAFAVAIAIGAAISLGGLLDPTLTRSDYVGSAEVTPEDAKLYRTVPFEWRIEGRGGTFEGKDAAHVRVDPSGERTLVCGWLEVDKAGASVRASRWLSQARLAVGNLVISAAFIAPVEVVPGNGLSAGCAGLYDGLKPAADSALSLDGPSVPE